MKKFSSTSDEAIKLTNILGLEIRNLEYSEGADKWYFRMIVNQRTNYLEHKARISIYQISHIGNEVWISGMMSDDMFNEFING